MACVTDDCGHCKKEAIKSRTIGFVRSGVHPLHVLAYKEILKKKGHTVFSVCEDLKEKAQYDKGIKVYCLEGWLKKNWDKFNMKRLRALSRKYDAYNLWEVYYTDRYMRYKYSHEDAVKLICGMITFWEYLLKDSGADYVASDCIIGANLFVGMIVGEKQGVRFIFNQDARYKQYHTFFTLHEGYENPVFYKYLDEENSVSEQELSNTRDYISNYINNRMHPEYIYSSVNASKNIRNVIADYAPRLWRINHFFDKKYKNKFNPHEYKSEWAFLGAAKEAARQAFVQKFFDEPDKKEDYFLFPLHFQPEASTCVYARKYENQAYFVEQLAKSIPVDKTLYVKEHSVRKGHKPISFYRELSRYPNVKIISWDADTHQLIKRASAVICLTSTVGFESLMYGKPVFMCGDTYFNHFSGVTVIHDVFDEKEKFRNPPVQDRELYIRQMACYLKSIQFCTFQEDPIHEETPQRLYEMQRDSINELMRFIEELENGVIPDKTKWGR